MTELRKAAEMALEALDCIYSPLHVREINKVGAAMAALRQALAQEPVLYMDSKQMPEGMPDWKPGMVFPKSKREWVWLTDEEKGWCGAPTLQETVARVEAKLKDKNT